MDTDDRPPNRQLSPETLQTIDDNLRRAYDSIIDTELPSRFQDLIARLAASTTETDSGTDDPQAD